MRNKTMVNVWAQDTDTNKIKLVPFNHSSGTSVNSMAIHQATAVTRNTKRLNKDTKVTTITVHTTTGTIEIECFIQAEA